MSSITVRFAGTEDAGLIADLSQVTFFETFSSTNSKEDMDKFMRVQFSREKLIAEVGAPDNIFLLAYMNDEAVGYTRISDNNHPDGTNSTSCMEIARFYALEKTYGKGVGHAMMKECIDIAVASNKKMIWLGVWEHNNRALAFYSKWGFERFSEHEFVLGDDVQTDWLLKKEM